MQPDATTTKMNTNKTNKDNEKIYKRNHIFFEEWKNWREIVTTFHSEKTSMLQKAINKGYRLYDYPFHPEDCYLIDQTYFITNEITPLLQSYKNHKYEFKASLDLFKKQSPYSDALLDDDKGEYSCYCYKNGQDVWNNNCYFKLQHLRAHIIAFIWAFFFIKSKREKTRIYRYYKRLEQVVLSLDYQHLKNFDYQLFHQPFYCPNKKNLLIYLYDRAYFDFATPREIRNIPYIFETWKHAREQGGRVTCQSLSDSSIFVPGCLELLAECAKDPFEVFLSKFKVKSQGLLDGFGKMEHDLNITDESIIKLKNLMESSQTSFLEGLKETILDSGAKLFSMFCIAATVSLLSRTIVGLGVNVILKMLHMIYCFICPQEVEEIKISYAYSQSGKEGVSIPFIPAMILNHIICPPKDILAKIWKSNTTDLIMKRIGYLGDMKIDRGIERMVDWIKDVIRKIQLWYGKDVLGIHCGLKGLFETEESPVSMWFKEIESLVCQYYNNEFRWTEMEFQVVYNLYKRGLGYTKSPEFIKYKYDIWNILRQLTSIMEKFKQHGISNQNIRNPPVTLYIYGGTGVGKSSMTYPLAVEILQEIHRRENSTINLRDNWKNMIYMRAPEQEFWDGYENQLVTIFDDFSQQTDSMQNPNLELFEIIRASNCFPYPLHMASLEQKASTVFSSKIIIASSNLQGPQCASLNFPDALKRRFDECVKVEREFTGHTDKFDPSLYKLEMYDIGTGVSKGIITYKDLVMRCVDDYFSRKNFVSSVENYIDGLFDVCTAVSQAGEVEQFEDALDETEEEFLKNSIPKTEKKSNLLRNFVDKYDPFAVIKYVIDFKIRDKVDNMIAEWNNFKIKHSYLYKTLTMFGCIGVGLGFLKIVSDFKNFKQAKTISYEEAGGRLPRSVKAESYTPAIPKTAKIESYTPAIPKVAKIEGNIVKSEGVKDINASEILMKVARTNLYKMYESTCGTAIGHVFFLKGKVAIMPKHYLSGLHQSLKNDPEAFVYFDAVLLNRSFEMKIKDLLKTRMEYDSPNEEDGPVFSRDLMAVSVKTSIYHSDATPYFVSKKNMCRTDSTEVMLPILINNNLATSDRACMLIRYSQGRSQLSVMETLSVCDTDDVITRYIRNAYMYSLDTQDTECGAPLIVRNTQIQPGKICGIHIAGMAGTGQGWSTPIYEDDVKNILNKFPENDQITTIRRTEINQYPQEQGKIPKEAEFIRLGVLEKGISQASKTKIVPSPLYGKIQKPVTKPCVLNQVTINGEIFRPAEYRLKRLGNVPKAIDETLIDNSRDALVDEIGTVLKEKSDVFNNNCKAVYSFEEACVGIEGEQYINSVKRDTSSGYPFIQMENFTRKDIFGSKEEYNLDTPQCNYLKQRVNTIIDNAKNNIQLDHYFVDTLKDERKPIEKAHKTRLFSAGPIDYLIACKMYYNGIVNLLSKTRNFCHISVGTNVYSNDWDTIVRVLHQKSKMLIAGDFEGFDASQHQRMLEAANEVLIKLSVKFLKSSEEDVRVMRVLGSTLVNSLHIYKDEVYQWTHSLASGHYLTAIINSIFVNLAFGCTWQISQKLYTYRTARMFWKTCGIVAYGDDHIVSIPLSKIKKFNQNNMKNLMAQIGLTYTLETKDEMECADYRTIENIQYLKRKFLFDKNINRYICPLDLKVVLEFPMWNHKCPDPVSQTIVELDKCIEELSLHETSDWKQWHPKLIECGEILGHFTVYKDQEETRSVALGNSLYL